MRPLISGFAPLLIAAGICAAPFSVSATSSAGVVQSQGDGASIVFMTPKGAPRTIDFKTDEGTLMSVDVAPDGQWIVFDLLGEIYRMPVRGGHAECLTCGSGVALNFHPRFSADGREIAFVSDRSGQANVWVMAADGTAPRLLFPDPEHRYAMPIWTRDGRSVLATRFSSTPGQGWHRRNASIWQLPLRGVPRPLLASTQAQYYTSAASPDGRSAYIYASSMARRGAAIYEIGFKLQTLDLGSRQLTDVATGLSSQGTTTPHPAAPAAVSAEQLAYDSGGNLEKAAEVNPVPSPDGHYLAFARAQSDGVMSFRGHNYRHRTVLYVLDLKSGAERKLLDPITKDFTNTHAHYSQMFLPGFAWTPDSRALILSVDGKIERVDLDGGRVSNVPFMATVHRVISAQTRRTAGLAPDDAVPVRFIQWPTASPDRRHLVFAALGRLWLMDLPDGKPRALTAEPAPDIQITPAWSPDGSQVAFATWNDHDRGQIRTFDVSRGTMSQVSSEPGEYIWPTWSPDGASLVAVRGPGAADARDAWNVPSGWQAVKLAHGAPAQVLAPVATPWQPLQVGDDGRVYFMAQWDHDAAQRTELPYPDAVEYELGSWILMSVDTSGGTPRAHLGFPAGPPDSNVAVLSRDTHRIAYQSDYQIFTERLDVAPRFAPLAHIDVSPNHARADRQRADQAGGVYARWHDDHTLEFAAGADYVTFDVDTGARRMLHVPLAFARDHQPGTVALLNARIIPMDGDKVIDRGNLIVRDGRISCVGKCATTGIGHTIDVSGKTLIPGLIDVHDHIANEPSGVVPLRRPSSLLDLAYGVTTIVDPAVPSATLFPLGEMTEAGRVLGPRAVGSADAVFGSVGGQNGTEASSFGPLLDLRSPADAEYQVARRAAWGAVIIKNYRQTSRQQQQWLIEAARAHGLSVTAEGDSVLYDLGMVMDGQTGWEHYLPAMPLYKDVSEFVGQAHTNYSPTVSVAGFPDGAMFYYRPRLNLQRDAKYARFASAALLKHVTPRDAKPPALDEFSFPIQAEGAADIIRAGGFVTIGEHGENPGMGSHWEIWAYAMAMKPLEALRVATYNGAHLVGLEHEVGSLEVGKLADLIVLNANPLEHIESTANIKYVMKSGRLYDADTLVEVWPSAPAAAPQAR